MPNLKFDFTVSVGNLLSIGVMLVAVTSAYVTVSNTQQTQAGAIAAMQIESRASEARLRTVEMQQAGQASDLRNIQALLARIDQRLEQLSRQP